jgi:adenine-specific DNA methylase
MPEHKLDIKQRAALDELHSRGLDVGPNTVITRFYGGTYFTWAQAIDLDALLAQIHEIDPPVRDALLASAFGAASEAVNTIGKHFAQPIRLRDTNGGLKRHLVAQTLRDRAVSILDSFETWQTRLARKILARGRHRAIRADFRDALADKGIEFDTVYADPPYTRDHYSRFYHILETMALHDEPPVSTTAIRSPGKQRLSHGLYRSDRHQSPFCIKSLVEGAFEELSKLVAMRDVPMVLSYSPYGSQTGNRPRLLTVERVAQILRGHFSNVQVESIAGSAHNKFNRDDRNAVVDYPAEMLLVCKP